MTTVEKIMAGLNLAFGALSFLLGFIILLLVMGDNSSGRGMAVAVLLTWAILGIATLPLFAHGFLYFKYPKTFYNCNHILLSIIIIVITAAYIKTEGFFDLFYSNEPYQPKEFICFSLMILYFVSQLFIFPGKINSMIRIFLKLKPE